MIEKRTRIYLDNAATTPLLPQARAAMEPYLSELCGNASSPYAVSRRAKAAIDEARREVAALINAQPDEIVWTSGGTESDNWALLGVALANLETRGHFIVSSVEHHAVLEPIQTLRQLGFEVDEARVDENGVLLCGEIQPLLRPDTLLVCVMRVNNETGVVQPVEEITSLLPQAVLLHSDGVQAAGKMALDVEKLGVDLMAISAHKFGGPRGVGALFIRRGTRMQSLLHGGAQERGRRAGTENVPAIVGMGVAAQVARENLEDNIRHLNELRERFESGLNRVEGACVNGRNAPRAPHVSNVSLLGRRAESLAMSLDLRGFAVGTGSACASGALEPSHVLTAMGLSQEAARSALRVSFAWQNTQSEVDELLAELMKM